MKLFKSYGKVSKLMDYIQYQPSSNSLVVTQNPLGFISEFSKDRYEGVHLESEQNQYILKDILLNKKNEWQIKKAEAEAKAKEIT